MIHQEIEYSSHSDRHEVTPSVGGAEEFDARTIREEEWPELENMVIIGKGLRRRSACSTETSYEDRKKTGRCRLM